MKKIGLLAISLLLLASCNKESKASLSGEIQNPADSILKLTNNILEKNEIEINIPEDGKFEKEFTASGKYLMTYGKDFHKTIYLESDKSINLQFDAEDFENTLTVEGEGSAATKYLWEKEKKMDELGMNQSNFSELYKNDETDFLNHLNNAYKELEDLLEEYDVSEDFKKKEKRDLEYGKQVRLANYPSYHAYYAEKPDYAASEKIQDETKDLNDFSNEEDYKFSGNYRNLVANHFEKQASDWYEENGGGDFYFHISKLIDDGVENNTIKGALLYRYAPIGLTTTDELEEYYQILKSASLTDEQKEELDGIYQKMKKVSKGQPSPTFEDYENHKGGTTSFEDLIGEKYVYFDIWATWCGPCIQEIPHLKKLDSIYADRNLKIVSISIDEKKDHEKWKKFVTDRELTGTQLFADSDWKSSFVQDYQIKGIPRFILVDPKGNIVNPNAPRPSEDALIELLESLGI